MIPIVLVLFLGFSIGLKATWNPSSIANRLLTNYGGAHEAQLEEAYSLIIQGDYTRAAVLAGSVVRADPEVALSYHILGLADAHRGLTEEAAINFQKACNLDPEMTVSWFSLGVVEESRAEYTRALVAYKKAAGQEPDNERYSDAVAHVEQIVLGEGGWDWQEALAGRLFMEGMDALSRGRPEDLAYAESTFRALVMDRPYNVAARNMLGLTLARQGNLAEAEQLFVRVVEEEPGFSDGWYNLGMVHRVQGHLEEALSDFETAHATSSLESFQAAVVREIDATRELLASEIPIPPPPWGFRLLREHEQVSDDTIDGNVREQ